MTTLTPDEIENLQTAPELATIAADALRKVEVLEAGRDDEGNALKEATGLAKSLARTYYADVTNWEVFDYTAGIISQIDNMVAGMPDVLKARHFNEAANIADNWYRGLGKGCPGDEIRAAIGWTPPEPLTISEQARTVANVIRIRGGLLGEVERA